VYFVLGHLVDKKDAIQVIYLVLDDGCVEVFEFFALFVAFVIQELYDNTLMSFDITKDVWDRQTGLFTCEHFFGFLHYHRIDHDGFSDKFVFVSSLFPLGCCYDSDVFAYLRGSQSDSIVCPHHLGQYRKKCLKLFIDMIDLYGFAPEDGVVDSCLDAIFHGLIVVIV